MILDSLVIENIRSYTHQEIEFPRGVSLFGGDIGSGKSTILMAIEFALFGLGSQKPNSLLAKKSDAGFVILEFTVDEQKYEIKRSLIKKKSSINQDPKNSWIKVDGQKELLSPSELKQKVLQILGFNEPTDPKSESRIFRYAVFTPQETMKNVLSEPAKRLDTIRKAFRIEDYSIAISNAKIVQTKLKIKNATLKGRFQDISEIESHLDTSKNTCLKLDQDISQNQAKMNKLKTTEAAENQQLKEIQEKNEKNIKLELEKKHLLEKINNSESEIDRINDDIKRLELDHTAKTQKREKLVEIKRPETTKSSLELEDEIQEIQKIKDDLIKYNTKKDGMISDIKKIKEKLSTINENDAKDKLEKLKENRITLESFASEAEKNHADSVTQKIQKQSNIQSLQKYIAKFSELGNKCPTCMQEIKPEHHHELTAKQENELQKTIKELELINISIKKHDLKLNTARAELQKCEKQIIQFNDVIPLISECNEKSLELEGIETEILQLKSSFEEFGSNDPIEYLTSQKNSIIQFENAAEQIQDIDESITKIKQLIENHQKNHQSIQSKIKSQKSQIQQIQSNLEQYDKMAAGKKEAEIKVIRDDIQKTSNIVAALNQNLTNEREKIKDNESRLEKSRKIEKKYKTQTQLQEWLELFFIPTVTQIEKQVLISLLQEFSKLYCTWYNLMIDDPTKESQIDENFTPIIHQDGYQQDVEFLSGGEKTSIALAYRLTLNSMMKKQTDSMKSNLLILDEPTDGLSIEQIHKIRTVFDELNSEQIILVSHEHALESQVDTLFKITKDAGVSTIQKQS